MALASPGFVVAEPRGIWASNTRLKAHDMNDALYGGIEGGGNQVHLRGRPLAAAGHR